MENVAPSQREANSFPSPEASETCLRAAPAITPAEALKHKGLVYYWARRFARPGVEHDDLVQAGFLGLLAAARIWCDDGGAAFGTYASQRIRGNMGRLALRERRRGVSGRLSAEVGHVSSVDDENAKEPSVSIDEDVEDDAPERLRAALGQLDERDRVIIERRLEGKTLEEVGELLGVTRQAINLREGKALDRLRKLLTRRPMKPQERLEPPPTPKREPKPKAAPKRTPRAPKAPEPPKVDLSAQRRDAEREAFARAFAAVPHWFTAKETEAVNVVVLGGRTLNAAAEHLGVSSGALQDRLGRARRGLKVWLERACYRAPDEQPGHTA